MKQELFFFRYSQHDPSKNVVEPKEDLPKKSYKDIAESKIKTIRKEVEEHNEAFDDNDDIKNERILWEGTSLSKSLDISNFKKIPKLQSKQKEHLE